MLKGVVFDMDGTLLDTEQMAMNAWLGAAKALDVPLTKEILTRTIGVNWESSKRIILEAVGDVPMDEMREKVHEFFTEWMERDGVPAKPGARELLQALKDAGIPVGLATSTARAGAEYRLRKAGLLEFFDGSACGDEIVHGKPAPDIFLLAAQRIGVAPECCAALEDSPVGIRAAKAAGMLTILIPDMVQIDAETKTFADHLLGNLFEARALLFEKF